MNLLFGGGSLKLKTDEFQNGEPSGLRVSDFFGFVVTNPIPTPEPPPNNVSGLLFSKNPYYFKLNFNIGRLNVPSINFKNVSLYGINLEFELQQLYRILSLKQDFIIITATNPILPPEPGPNNVSYISFSKVPAFGIKIQNDLKKITRNLKFKDRPANFKKTLGTVKVFGSSNFVPIEMKIWTGREWQPAGFKVWNGNSWV
jgi:hypothetical protein